MIRQDFIQNNSGGLNLRFSIPLLVTSQEEVDIFAMKFHLWMLRNDTEENAERFFHYELTDMLNEFKKEEQNGI